MKKRLLLIRHAQSEANKEGRVQGWLDSELSVLGHRHAELVSRRVAAEFQVAEIFCSPLRRATQTASYLGQQINRPLTLIEDLKEQNLGPLSGLTKEEIKFKFPQLEHAWVNNLPRPPLDGIESDYLFAKRINRAIKAILNTVEPETTAAVFAHGGTLNQMLKNWLKISRGGRLTFTFNNASLTIVDVYPTFVRLIVLNDTHHYAGATYDQRDNTYP